MERELTTSGGPSWSYLDDMDRVDQDLLIVTRSRPKSEALRTPRTSAVSMKINKGGDEKSMKKAENENSNK